MSWWEILIAVYMVIGSCAAAECKLSESKENPVELATLLLIAFGWLPVIGVFIVTLLSQAKDG